MSSRGLYYTWMPEKLCLELKSGTYGGHVVIIHSINLMGDFMVVLWWRKRDFLLMGN